MDLVLLPDTDPILRKVAEPITVFDDDLLAFCKQLRMTMINNQGIGLAAPQVGVSKRIIIADVGVPEIAFVNPEIIEQNGQQLCKEGCLSFPGLFLDIERARHVKMTYQDFTGVSKTIEVGGTFAVVVQHEIDHLNGILFIERANAMRVALARKKLAEKRRG